MMLGPGHYGEFIITELKQESEGAEMKKQAPLTEQEVSDWMTWQEAHGVGYYTRLLTRRLISEWRKLRAASITTLRECSAPDCKLGIQNQYAALGMCVMCAEETIAELRWDVAALILASKDAQREIKRLRGIERAALMNLSRVNLEMMD